MGFRTGFVQEMESLQANIYDYVFPNLVPFNLEDLFCYRFLLREWFDEYEARRMAGRAVAFLEEISNATPPCVIFAVLNTYLNGWSTGARFQEKNSKCLLCIDCEGEDRLEHYGSCIFMWRDFARRYGKSIFPMSLARFLGLFAESHDLKLAHAVNMFAVRTATNFRRRSGTRECEDKVHRLIGGGFKTACLHKGSLSKKLGRVCHSST